MKLATLLSLLLLPIACAHAQSESVAIRVSDERGMPVSDAVVVAVPADGSLRLPPRPREEIVDQVDKEFVPRVQAVLVGSAVVFPNHDSVRHQVYSFSPAKRFELPLYTGVPQAVVFDKPGVVVLGCNIHDWMVGYVYVSESPYFAKTDATGRAILADLPARDYVVRVWHPQLVGSEDATHKVVTVPSGQQTEAAWTVKLKPQMRIRRAPTAGQRGSY